MTDIWLYVAAVFALANTVLIIILLALYFVELQEDQVAVYDGFDIFRAVFPGAESRRSSCFGTSFTIWDPPSPSWTRHLLT